MDVPAAEPDWNSAQDSTELGPVHIPHRDSWSSWSSWNEPNGPWSSWSSWDEPHGPGSSWSSWDNDYSDDYYGDYYYDYSSATCATFAISLLLILAQ